MSILGLAAISPSVLTPVATIVVGVGMLAVGAALLATSADFTQSFMKTLAR